MRAIIFILILAVVAVIALLATGMVDINTVRGARAPNVAITDNGVSASGAQAPAFEVETGSVAVGKGQATVPVPKVEVRPAGNEAAANTAQ